MPLRRGLRPRTGGADPRFPWDRGWYFIYSSGIPGGIGYDGDFTPGLGTQARLMVIITANRAALLWSRNSRSRSPSLSAAAADCMGKVGCTEKTISAPN